MFQEYIYIYHTYEAYECIFVFSKLPSSLPFFQYIQTVSTLPISTMVHPDAPWYTHLFCIQVGITTNDTTSAKVHLGRCVVPGSLGRYPSRFFGAQCLPQHQENHHF